MSHKAYSTLVERRKCLAKYKIQAPYDVESKKKAVKFLKEKGLVAPTTYWADVRI